MNALFISNDPRIVDSHSQVRQRMNGYASAIGTLHIVLRADTDRRINDGPLSIHEVKTSKLLAPFTLARMAHSLIRQEGVAVVSAQDPFEHGLAAFLAVRGTSAKLHIQVHTDFLSPWFLRSGNPRAPKVIVPLNNLRLILANLILPQADGIRVVSNRVRDSILKKYRPRVSEPTVIPIAVPLQEAEAISLPAHAWTFSLISVSRLAPEKRIEDILFALAMVRATTPAVGLFIIGDGPEEKRLHALARFLKIEDAVSFLGWRNDANALLKSAQAYIQASAYEGYGMSLIEAALARLPIITTDVGIVGEVFTGYKDVFAVPPADPTALAACIRNLLENHQSREVLGRSAETAARAHVITPEAQATLVAEDLSRILVSNLEVITGTKRPYSA